MSDEFVKKVSNVRMEDYPRVISDQVAQIALIQKEIEANRVTAERLTGNAEDLKTEERDLFSPSTWFKGTQKNAIGQLQSHSRETARALQSVTKAQQLLFAYQKKMTDVTKFLFGLGISSLAANRLVIRQLLLEMENATDAEKAKIVEEEINKIIAELKVQQDIMVKQEELEKKAKITHEDVLKIQENYRQHLETQSSVDKAQQQDINKNKLRLDEKDQIDAAQTKKLEELDKLLVSINQEHEMSFQKNAEEIEILFEYMKQKHEIDHAQQNEIDELKILANSNVKKVSIFLSLVAIVISTISVLKVFGIFF